MTPRPASTSSAEVVRHAMSLLEEQGPEAFSMRKLGAAMGIDPMTVYHHVPNKAALFDLVVDELWSGMHPQADGGWSEQVSSLAHELRRVLLEHPRLVVLVATRPIVTPRLMGLADELVGRLDEQGLPSAQAMQLLDCVVAFTVGKVQGELRQPVGGDDLSPEQALAAMAEQAPHLARAASEGYGWQPDEEFTTGLGALLAGWPVSSGSTAGS
ncbi:TetR/AcrR family transcriptional regulator [Luteococcus peritonei]|uniref:TetR/AcrR family transcriptional regulator n=1 Tax=Luteococcus peritonei TaxID=88874 RepID=A0ABW4S1D8_9ACTN